MSASRKLFVNLPVKDLQRSMDFFKQLGFTFNPQFSDENAACMVIGEDNYAMLLTEPFYKTFTTKEITDAAKSSEVILAVFLDKREEVDVMVKKAFAAGAKPFNDPQDHGFMYGWSFQDLDDHLWEVGYMDPAHIQDVP